MDCSILGQAHGANAVCARAKEKFVPQLFGRDLQSGDILLQVNTGTVVQQAIRLGQKAMGSGNEELIHAGILFDNRYLIESAGKGIGAADIYLQDKPYAYQVYRASNPALAGGAATCAKIFMDIHARTGGMPYSVKGAVASIFKTSGAALSRDQMEVAFDELISDKRGGGKNHPFFCSQFVVFIFQFVAEQNNIAGGKVFPFKDGSVPPGVLASNLKTNPLFREAGYMLANQR
jgi:hypothetical protein